MITRKTPCRTIVGLSITFLWLSPAVGQKGQSQIGLGPSLDSSRHLERGMNDAASQNARRSLQEPRRSLDVERSQSTRAKKEANRMQQKVNEDEKRAQKADDSRKSGRDHQQGVKDAIKKTLEQVNESKRAADSLGR